jgi:hypothetical protein
MPRGAPVVRLLLLVSAVLCVIVSSDARLEAWIFHGRRAEVSEASVRAHMEMLAGDAMNGRASGTRDEWIAATYVASRLRQSGLDPLGDDGGFVQAVETPRREVVSPPVMMVDSWRGTHGRDFTVRVVGAPRVEGPLTRFVTGATVAPGAVVLVVGPDELPREVAARAAAVITVEVGADRPRPDAAVLPRVASAPGPWEIALGPDAFAALTKRAEGSVVSLEADVRPGRTWNVLGRIPGASRPRETILLSAHLDHLGVRGTGADTIYNGADDDASGVTAVLELARVLASGPRPERTVVVALYGSEEAGGFGARHFLDQPPVPLTAIVANLEFEMIGRPDPALPPRTIWLTGYERTTLGPALAAHGARLVADPHPEQGFFMRSDNIQLARRGVVAQTISSYGLHREYHTPADDLSHIDLAHMTRVIASLVRPVVWLANSAFVPAWRPGMQPEPRRTPAP